MELFVSTQNAYETQVSPPVEHRYRRLQPRVVNVSGSTSAWWPRSWESRSTGWWFGSRGWAEASEGRRAGAPRCPPWSPWPQTSTADVPRMRLAAFRGSSLLSRSFQAEEAGEVHAGQGRGHADHWRETPFLWEIQGGRLPPGGGKGGSNNWSERGSSAPLIQEVKSPVLSLQVGFLSSGKVVALDVSLYSNAGDSLNLSLSVSLTPRTQTLPICRRHPDVPSLSLC